MFEQHSEIGIFDVENIGTKAGISEREMFYRVEFCEARVLLNASAPRGD